MGTRTPRPKKAKSSREVAPKAARAPKPKEKQPEKHSGYLKGNRIYPQAIEKGALVADLIDNAFTSYNAGRLREACRLFTEKMLAPDCTVGVSLSGALTPTGLGKSVLIPLIEHGFIDWIISTGANLYHDAHFGIGLKLHYGSPFLDDRRLREEGVVRIYDILFDYHVLLDTDRFFRTVLSQPEFQGPMSTAEFHNRVGKYVHETEKQLGIGTVSLLSAAYQYDVPIYTSSPGDSSIGMNVAGLQLAGSTLSFDVSRRRERDRVDRPRGETGRGKVRRDAHRRREPEELHAPDRAADPGSADDRRGGARLLPPDHRRAPRHGRALGRHAGRGGLVGEGAPRLASRRRRLLLATRRSPCRSSPPMRSTVTRSGSRSASTAAGERCSPPCAPPSRKPATAPASGPGSRKRREGRCGGDGQSLEQERNAKCKMQNEKSKKGVNNPLVQWLRAVGAAF